MSHESRKLKAEAITQGPMHHFVGYYDKCCWNRSGRYVFCQEIDFYDRNPTEGEPLTIGVVDMQADRSFKPLVQTHAWNWQQACMSRWMPPEEENVLAYNDMCGDHYACIQYNMDSGEKTELPWPVYDISPDGRLATSMNFIRITYTRPGYGYFTDLADPYGDQLHPADDGVYICDLHKKERRLIFSLADGLKIGKIRPETGHKAWVNCLKFNPSGNRLLFLHRWAPKAIAGHVGFFTRLITINADGTDPAVILEGLKISHFDWYDDEHILVWLESPERGIHDYCMVHDPSGEIRKVGENMFESDGHCNLSPNRRWMVTDTYPKGPRNEQALILFDMERNRRVDVGAFPAIPVPDDSMRCDLHTRWNRDGTQLCFDSTHEGSRQVYVMDVSEITRE
jgi:hypothetical protein